MHKKRHSYTPEEKVHILKRHLLDRVAISDLCDECHLQPAEFCAWQKQFFENGTQAFVKDRVGSSRRDELRIRQLEEKINRKQEVLSELMEEHVKLKMELGEL